MRRVRPSTATIHPNCERCYLPARCLSSISGARVAVIASRNWSGEIRRPLVRVAPPQTPNDSSRSPWPSALPSPGRVRPQRPAKEPRQRTATSRSPMRNTFAARSGNTAGATDRFCITLPGSLVRPHEIPLADGQPVVAQDGVGSGDVKQELRQAVVRQIGLTDKLLFLGRAGTEHDF